MTIERANWTSPWDEHNLVHLQNLAVAAYASCVTGALYEVDDAPSFKDGNVEIKIRQDVPGDFPQAVLEHLDKSPCIYIGGVCVVLDDDCLYFSVRRSFSEKSKEELLAISDAEIVQMVAQDSEKLDAVFFDYKKVLSDSVAGRRPA